MRTWLHWIGVKFYTIRSFIFEAKKMGVSRRVPPIILRGMGWGDRIYLIGESPKFPGYGIVFGFFFLTRMKYTTKKKKVEEEIFDYLSSQKFKLEVAPPSSSERGCGYETEGGYYIRTDAKIQQIANILTKDRKALASIKGALVVGKEAYLLKIGSFRGYKDIDFNAFSKELEGSKKVSMKELLSELDIKVMVKAYVKLRKKYGIMKDEIKRSFLKSQLRGLRKRLKAEGVWKDIKEEVSEEMSLTTQLLRVRGKRGLKV